jgi:hypothetical protein
MSIKGTYLSTISLSEPYLSTDLSTASLSSPYSSTPSKRPRLSSLCTPLSFSPSHLLLRSLSLHSPFIEKAIRLSLSLHSIFLLPLHIKTPLSLSLGDEYHVVHIKVSFFLRFSLYLSIYQSICIIGYSLSHPIPLFLSVSISLSLSLPLVFCLSLSSPLRFSLSPPLLYEER